MLEHPNWLVFEKVLDEETCNRWLELGKSAPVQEAATFNSDDSHRKTDISWLPNEGEYQEIHDVLKAISLQANQHFKLTLTHLPPLQFTQYSDVGHHYDMHHDVNYNRQDGYHRKLSFVVQLSDPEDYEGGLLSFSETETPDSEILLPKGTVICFLSYLQHGVSPITKGSRTSLVGWFEGPRWR